MIYHVREYGYTESYADLFKGLAEIKEYRNCTIFLDDSTPMYNLDGERGKVHILTTYSSMGEYEKINDQMDRDETLKAFIMENMKSINLNVPIVDHFYRGIS